MMSELSIEARTRGQETPNRLRREGYVPAVVYGPSVGNRSVAVKERELVHLLQRGGMHTPIRLELPEGNSEDVMIKELQQHPSKGNILHVDFLALAMDRKITTQVPLRIDGEDKATQGGAIVQHQLREVGVSCLPKDLPEVITVDISDFKVGDVLTVGNLTPPPGVEFTDDAESVVLTVVQPRLPEAEGADEADGEESPGGEDEQG